MRGPLGPLLGRSAPPEPVLDRLFALADVAGPLAAATGFTPGGTGAVAHRSVEGGPFGAFARTHREVLRLLRSGAAPEVETCEDEHGWAWIRIGRPPGTLGELPGDLHMVNALLQEGGFGPYLLCSVVCFERGPARLGLVHLYRRGTFYPYAPLPGGRRDAGLEREAAAALAGEIPVEPDTGRWFPVRDAPGL
ncbi:PspA-associated protein PspAB [Actinomadura macrotermitis]|uniref:Uncharacterized protein n=1 Tax=Actinomadura macrotermitis TaxID=2585200 RepID=A0A7K0BMV4_9ACTN|nr:hypothetical protein [Actinomadura macrotermitis]